MAHRYSLDHVRDDTDEDQQEQQHYSYAIELTFSSVLPMVMRAAVELQVLDVTAKAGPGAQLSPYQIVSRLPAADTLVSNPDAPEMLERMLRLLASHSILTCSLVNDDRDQSPDRALVGRRLYGLAPVAKYFVPNQDGVSLAPFLYLAKEKAFASSW